jgi:hypothetical protein
MGLCNNHPERETQYICMKYQTYLCDQCLTCKDPKIYCKYRSSCTIWFMSKRQDGLDDKSLVLQNSPTKEEMSNELPD